MKVLVVERNRELRQHVVNTLRSADFQVEECQSCSDLTEQTRTGRVILVVGSRDHDVLSNEEMRQRLADSPNFYLVMLLEAGSMIDQVKDGLRKGADDFVFQPTQDAELILRVGIAERILNLKAVSRELPTTLTAPKFQRIKSPSPIVRI